MKKAIPRRNRRAATGVEVFCHDIPPKVMVPAMFTRSRYRNAFPR